MKYLLIICVGFLSPVFSQTLEETYELVAKHPSRAEGYVNLAMRKYPRNGDVYLLRAKVYAYNSHFKKATCTLALIDVNHSIRFNPRNPYAYAFKAELFYRMNKVSKPEDVKVIMEALKKAYVLEKENLAFSINYVYGLLRLKKPAAAWEILEPLVEKHPQNYHIQSLYATYLNVTNKPVEAIEVIEILKNIEKPKKRVVFLGRKYEGIFDKDFAYIKEFHAKNMTLDDAIKSSSRKLYVTLYNYYRKKNTLKGVSWGYSLFHVRVLMELGRYKESLALGREMVKAGVSGKALTNVYLLLGRAYSKLHVYDKAGDYFEMAVKRADPGACIEHLQSVMSIPDYKKAAVLKKEYSQNKYHPKMSLSLDIAWHFKTESFEKFYTSYDKCEEALTDYHFSETALQYNSAKLMNGELPANKIAELDKWKKYELYVENCYVQANAWFMQGKKEEWKSCIKKAMAYTTEDVRHGYYAALFETKKGHFEEAAVLVDNFLEKAPFDTDGLLLRGNLSLHEKNYKKASKAFSKLLSEKEKSYCGLVKLVCQGKTDQAVLSAESLLENHCKDERIILLYHSLISFLEPDSAKKFLDRKGKYVLNELYKRYVDFHKGSIAEEALYKGLDKNAAKATIIYLYQGIIAMQKADKEKARQLLEKCLNPLTADMSEYHMAAGLLKLLN